MKEVLFQTKSLEEKLPFAIVEFSVKNNYRYEMKFHPTYAPEEFYFQITKRNSKGENILCAVDVDKNLKFKQPFYPSQGTPDKKIYNDFCKFVKKYDIKGIELKSGTY